MAIPERHSRTRQITMLAHWLRAGILCGGFALRCLTLQAQPLWRDEVDQWRYALAPWNEIRTNFTRAGWNGPLYTPLLRLWIALSGDSVFAMRYLSVLWGVLSIAALYVLARRVAGHGVGRWAACLLALSPYSIWYAQEIKMYTWVPLLVLVALCALDRACESARSRWWWGVLIATSLAFYSHILAALLIPVELVWFLLQPRRHPRAWVWGLVVGLGLVLPYLPLVFWQAPLLLQVRETGFPSYTLGQMALMLFNGWVLGIHQAYRSTAFQQMAWGDGWSLPVLLDWALLLFYGLAVGGAIVQWMGRERWKRLASLLLWLGLPLICIWLVSLRGPIFTDRYLIWCSPALYILIGIALAKIESYGPGLLTVPLAIVVFTAASGVVGQSMVPIKPQFDRAAAYLEQARHPDDLLLFQIPYNRHVLEYYLRPKELARWADAPFTNHRSPEGAYQMSDQAVGSVLQGLVGGYRAVWLVYSEVALWDERELVRAWLDTHGRVVDRQLYHGVELVCYQLPVQGD